MYVLCNESWVYTASPGGKDMGEAYLEKYVEKTTRRGQPAGLYCTRDLQKAQRFASREAAALWLYEHEQGGEGWEIRPT